MVLHDQLDCIFALLVFLLTIVCHSTTLFLRIRSRLCHPTALSLLASDGSFTSYFRTPLQTLSGSLYSQLIITFTMAVSLHGSAVPLKEFVQLINHVALPPQLPQRADEYPGVLQKNLLCLVQGVIPSVNHEAHETWRAIASMLTALGDVMIAEHIDPVKLLSQISALSPGSMYLGPNTKSHVFSLLTLNRFSGPLYRRTKCGSHHPLRNK